MMGIVNMVRHVRRLGGANAPIAVTASEVTTDKIAMSESAFGSFILGAGLTSATFWTIAADGSTRVPIYDENGNAVARTGLTAGRSYPLPKEVGGVDTLLVVANQAGTIEVVLKG
jgi:hypothetical protein